LRTSPTTSARRLEEQIGRDLHENRPPAPKLSSARNYLDPDLLVGVTETMRGSPLPSSDCRPWEGERPCPAEIGVITEDDEQHQHDVDEGATLISFLMPLNRPLSSPWQKPS
jgi:hypothetical protein